MLSVSLCFRQTCSDKCLGTSQSDQLNCGGPDSRAASVNKNPVTSCEPGHAVEQLVGRQPDLSMTVITVSR